MAATGRGVSRLTLCMFQSESGSYRPGCQPADAVYVSECQSVSYRPGCQPADAVFQSVRATATGRGVSRLTPCFRV